MEPVGVGLQRPGGGTGFLNPTSSYYGGEATSTVSAFSNSTADWQCLDSVWYRKVHVFDMLWPPERQRFEAYLIAAAPYGGPIACVRNEKVFQPARRNIKPELQIFTARGRLIATTPWVYSRLVCFNWNVEEILVCVFQDGVVRTFSPQCEKLHFFSLDERIRGEGGVVQARVAACGIVVVTAALKIYVNQAFDRSLLLLLPDAGLRGPPLALCALPSGKPVATAADVLCSTFAAATATTGGTLKLEEPRLLVAAESGPLLLLDPHSCTDLNIEGGPFVTLSLSRSGNLLVGLTSEGHLKVLSTAGTPRCIVSPFLERQRKPRQVAWCGDDCIALNIPMHTPSGDTQHVLLLGGPKDEWIPYQYGSSSSGRGSGAGGGIYLISEVDGVRVISANKTEFLHRLPHSTDAIFSIGSCEPPAMLCYAMEKFKASDAAADESLRAIARDLGAATEACIDAATYEWKYEQAAFLLQAAVFGRQFLDRQHKRDCHQFVRACRDLRVCYAVRQGPLDMALSVAQLRRLSLSELVRRIANRREHLLAYRICEYVGLPARGVLASWALEKIHHSIYLTDEELSDVICSRLADAPHATAAVLGHPPPPGVLDDAAAATAAQDPALPFARVALCAAQAGRPVLATRLVEFEPLTREQVRMLLKLAEVNVATEKAVATGNSDLVMQCISAALAHEHHAQGGDPDLTLLVDILQGRPLAQEIFAAFCRETGQLHLLLHYYERSGNLYLAGWTAVTLSRRATDEEKKKKWLAHAAGFFASRRANDLASFAHSSALYQINLISHQREVELKMKRPHALPTSRYGLGPSLMQTLRDLILRREFKEADNLQKLFKVPEHRYWRCKIDALADGQHFDVLLALGTSKTSPVGYEPFITACVRNDAPEIAAKFVPKLKDLGQQYLWYSHLGMRAEAEAAAKQAGAQSIGGGLFQTLTDAFKGRR